jgi:hypothetical protein
MPNLTIIPIGYSGFETSTLFLTKSFLEQSDSFSKKFSEPFVEWPIGSSKLNPNLVLKPTAYGTYAAVQATVGAMGYMTLPTFNVASSGSIPYALLKFNNEVYEATQENVVSVFQDATRDKKSGIIKVPKFDNQTKGWPMNALTYLLLSNNTDIKPTNNDTIDCEQIRGTLQFFRWALIDPEAQTQSSFNGFFATPSSIRDDVLEELMQIQCEDEIILDLEVIDDHADSYFEALLAFSMVCCAIFLLPGFLLLFAKDSEGNYPGVISIIYTILLLLGALLVYLSLIFFYLTPDETWVSNSLRSLLLPSR